MALDRMELTKDIGTRIKKIRLELGYTQEQMAAFFGIKRAGYRRYEGGETTPGVQAFEMLAERFNVSLEWLIRGEGSMVRSVDDPEPRVPEFEKPVEEIWDLVVHMEKIPLLRFKILSFYHQFKMDHSDLFSDN